MYQYAAIIAIIALRIIFHPSHAQNAIHGFDRPARAEKVYISSFTQVKAEIVNNKVILHWTIGANEKADMFEVEKSLDGKHFKTAALVFTSEAPNTAHYQFYENLGNRKWQYRIKLVDKDKRSSYSGIVAIDPATKI